MPAPPRPRRSALFMLASNARALEKARGLAADVIIMDLEDAVAPDMKDLARAQAISAVSAGGYGRRELVIRANGADAAWHDDDITAIATSGADAMLLAKVEGAGVVHHAEAALKAAGAPDGLAIWCMIETPLGVLRASEIAGASPRLGALVMGTSDLTKDLQARHTADRAPLMTSFGLCLLAARAHGLAILDGVHLDLADDAGLIAVCRQGADLGFDGKTLIHPKTLGRRQSCLRTGRGGCRLVTSYHPCAWRRRSHRIRRGPGRWHADREPACRGGPQDGPAGRNDRRT